MQLSLVRIWSTLKEFTNVDFNSEFQNIRQWWNDHDSGIRSWNKVSTGSLTINGTSGTITDWTAYTPTAVGLGTISNVSFFWKQIGNSIYVRGTLQGGTPSGSAVTLTLPNSTVINTSHAFASSILGTSSQLVAGAGPTTPVIPFVFTDNSDTSHVYFGTKTGSSLFVKLIGTNFISANDSVVVDFSYPI